MGIHKLAGQYDRHLEEVKSPSNSRDIHCGAATVLYGWTRQGEGWAIPGGVMIRDPELAMRAAKIINAEIERGRRKR